MKIPQTKTTLRRAITRFLNQRMRAYSILFQQTNNTEYYNAMIKVKKIRQSFEMIKTFDYWRHCREIKLQTTDLKAILPAASGHHRSIRENMIELIRHCTEVQKIPCELFRAENTAEGVVSVG